MNKKIVQAVQERSKGLCEICGSPYMTQIHHIVKGKGKRREHENKYSVILLCWDCHMGNKGVHGRDGRELDLYLKKKLQEKYFNLGYTENEVREKMGGKLY
ncbi:HNH endonuclease [Anaerosalibacter massiliensis]|jgi:5-methylcytosine-specific restriction endonuclease McrA|uniref:HNH endonuclease n=1 Tax=Anaerosalibacter massiliensis TaxID=1347392 RepID=UPI0005B2E593|nr:HNH endonuclease [Anaerosalibacter massiliensis]